MESWILWLSGKVNVKTFGFTYLVRDPKYSRFHEPFKNRIHFLNICTVELDEWFWVWTFIYISDTLSVRFWKALAILHSWLVFVGHLCNAYHYQYVFSFRKGPIFGPRFGLGKSLIVYHIHLCTKSISRYVPRQSIFQGLHYTPI